MVRGICRFWAALRGYRVAYFGGQHVAAWRRRCNGDQFGRTTILADTYPMAGPGRRRVDSSTGGDYTPDAGRGSHSFPVDCATGRLSTELHHLLRIAAFLLPCGVCPLTSHIARLHVIPPMARPRSNGPPRGDRPVYPGALCLLYGVSRRVSPAETSSAPSHRFLCDRLAWRSGRRFICWLAGTQCFPRVLRISDRPGALRPDGRDCLWARFVERTARSDADRYRRDGGFAGRLLLLPRRHHVSDGGRLQGGGAQFLRPTSRGRRRRPADRRRRGPEADPWSDHAWPADAARRVPPAACHLLLPGERYRARHEGAGRSPAPHRDSGFGMRHSGSLWAPRRHATDLRDQPAGGGDREARLYLSQGYGGQSGSCHGRCPPGSGSGAHRTWPVVRHSGDGCLLGRFGARSPRHEGSLCHLFPTLETRRHSGGEHLEQLPGAGPGDGTGGQCVRQGGPGLSLEPEGGRLHVLFVLLDTNHGTRHSGGPSGVAEERRNPPPRAAFQGMDRQFFQHVQYLEVKSADGSPSRPQNCRLDMRPLQAHIVVAGPCF